jgi:hypothetical protein
MFRYLDQRYNVMITVTLCITIVGPVEAVDVIHIASDEQLFLDEDHIIEKQDNITGRIHQAHKYGPPVLRPDKPWEEGTALIFGSAIFDEEEHLFKMWYYTGSAGVAYATSTDGVHWDKPELDVYPYEGQKTNLIAKMGQWDYFREIVGVHKDIREPDPARRYKMVFVSMQRNYKGPHANRYRSDKRIGLGIACSPDGIHFALKDLFATEEVCDISHLFYDDEIERFVAYGRCLLSADMPLGTRFKRWGSGRAVVHLTSPDLENWTLGEFVYAAEHSDPPGTEIYSISAFPYGGMYICMIQMFHGRRDQGLLDYQIGFSPNRKDVIRPGPRAPFLAEGGIGQWDRFNISLGELPPITVGDEWWFYYGGRTYRHSPYEGPDNLDGERAKETKIYRSQIGLAKVKRGRLYSLEASFDSGYVRTRPFYFEGSKLFVNANARYGLITIHLYDENSKSIPNGSVTIIGRDDVDIPVEFAGLNLAEFKGKPVKMKITLENAQLYGFRVD